MYLKSLIILLLLMVLTSFSSCKNRKFGSFENQPVNSQERARKNVEEGKGAGLGQILGKRGTNYEFSSSNPMWRASLELLDFLPLTTVDYSGGMIISDWYSDDTKSNESIKISIRFLSNEIRSDSLKIIVHKKKCSFHKIVRQFFKKTLKLSLNLEIAYLLRQVLLKKKKKRKKNNFKWKE